MLNDKLKQYSSLGLLMASEVLKNRRRVEDIKLVQLQQEVREIIEDRDLIVTLFVTRVINGVDTLQTVPEVYKGDVESFLGQQSTSILLLIADIIDGVKTLEDIPADLRPTVEQELDRLLGKKTV